MSDKSANSLTERSLDNQVFRGRISSVARFGKRTMAVRYVDSHKKVNQRVVWSPNKKFFGQHVYSDDGDYLGAHILISDGLQSCIYEIPPGAFLREFLVDDYGCVAAWILDDAENCHPQIYERDFKKFPRAWNLHWTEFGGIAFNALRGEEVISITDETELLLH